MAINPTCLDVYFENDLVGHLFDTSPLSFEYAAWWRDHKALQIATITLAAGRTSADGVTSFFENLLPEGELRSYLFTQRKASTLFGLLYAVAGDTAGGFVLLPSGQRPEPHQYQTTSWDELAAELRTKAALAISLKSQGTRISLAGAQDKLSIALFEDGIPRLGEGSICFPCNLSRFGFEYWRGDSPRRSLIPLGFQAASLPRIVGVPINGHERCKAGTPPTWV